MNEKGYTNPQLVMTPAELHERLNDPKLCLIDTRPVEEFVQGHIPGAAHFDLFGISLNDTSPAPLASFIWMMESLLASRGVDWDKTVVFYEENSGVRAARGFWLLEYMGHEDVHILDGGIKAWLAAGLPVTSEVKAPSRGRFQGKRHEEYNASYTDILERLGKNEVAILDTRSDGEYYGQLVRAARGGTIPGSVHIEWLQNLDENGAFKKADDLKALYASKGITPDKEIVCF
ncbi:MAG: sulfurtransferase [Candidatus Tectomicrobia bacterium]|nr:sulfurtransferase [Candidatus Tectomicrobia bacterium]